MARFLHAPPEIPAACVSRSRGLTVRFFRQSLEVENHGGGDGSGSNSSGIVGRCMILRKNRVIFLYEH
ncbi:hypothetical protein Pmani_037541 [Petrolisthes manimaculis]|uniref:Uncharacterized protein n=1 Tax=Petrolisthes manimaculis TaxID=1843537 RepID=A0AAE1TN73_9EUCA|nr:hypothetical protein Pmani_037541 [Petrolisthes manimaculis]